MRCSKCGSEIPDHANFCRNCGSPTRNNMTWLVQRARANDQQALAEIYEISSPAVYKAIRVLIKDEDTVYDILQDTYVKAFTRLDQLQDAEKLIPWLKMIANNRAKDWLKKSKPVFFTDISGTEEEDNVSFEESIEDVRSDMNPEMSMDEKEVRRLVMEILDQLPEDQRIVIGMFYYEEMPVKDIAAALEVSENTVKSRLSYGRKKIKEQVLDLEKHGTKLYNVAPFVFFLYLLRRVDSVSAEPLDPDALQGILNSCSGGISGNNLHGENPIQTVIYKMAKMFREEPVQKAVRVTPGIAQMHTEIMETAGVIQVFQKTEGIRRAVQMDMEITEITGVIQVHQEMREKDGMEPTQPAMTEKQPGLLQRLGLLKLQVVRQPNLRELKLRH